jgi:hypothetical protein
MLRAAHLPVETLSPLFCAALASPGKIRLVRRVTWCPRAADDNQVSTDAQTQSIPRVPAAVVAVTDARVAAPGGDTKVAAAEPAARHAPAPASDADADAEIAVPEADAEVAAPGPSTEIGCEESVEHIYEAGLARLEALHDRWAAALAEIRQAPAGGEAWEAAA